MCGLLRALLADEDVRRPRWTFHGLFLRALKLGLLLVCLNELLYVLSFEEVRAVVYQERLVRMTAAVNQLFTWAVLQLARRKAKGLLLIGVLAAAYQFSKTREGVLWRSYNWCFRCASRAVKRILI